MENQQFNLYYITEHPILIQRKCRNFAASTLFSFMFGCLIIALLQQWIPQIISVFYTVSYWDLFADKLNLSKEVIAQLPDIPIALLVYTILFAGVIQVGKCLYALTYIRNKKVEYGAIFEGFKLFPKALAMYIVQMLIISVFSMLFIIPGIIAYFSYQQSFYILADNPDKNILACMGESKIRMRGNKMKLFMLDLSYFPILFLCYLPILVSNYLTNIDTTTLTGALLSIVTEIPFFAGVSLLILGQTVFYELLIQGGFQNFKYAAQEEFRTID